MRSGRPECHRGCAALTEHFANFTLPTFTQPCHRLHLSRNGAPFGIQYFPVYVNDSVPVLRVALYYVTERTLGLLDSWTQCSQHAVANPHWNRDYQQPESQNRMQGGVEIRSPPANRSAAHASLKPRTRTRTTKAHCGHFNEQ